MDFQSAVFYRQCKIITENRPEKLDLWRAADTEIVKRIEKDSTAKNDCQLRKIFNKTQEVKKKEDW